MCLRKGAIPKIFSWTQDSDTPNVHSTNKVVDKISDLQIINSTNELMQLDSPENYPAVANEYVTSVEQLEILTFEKLKETTVNMPDKWQRYKLSFQTGEKNVFE